LKRRRIPLGRFINDGAAISFGQRRIPIAKSPLDPEKRPAGLPENKIATDSTDLIEDQWNPWRKDEPYVIVVDHEQYWTPIHWQYWTPIDRQVKWWVSIVLPWLCRHELDAQCLLTLPHPPKSSIGLPWPLTRPMHGTIYNQQTVIN
jgi:hypothetical protein